MIHQLGDRTVQLLSCSQVISSIHSAVKELVENSLDAKATSVEVRLDNYGLDLLEVRDNGMGVKKEDVESMTLPHSTSKISSFQDLTSLQTYGFRGEALHSLARMATLSVITRTEAEEVAMRYDFSGTGQIISARHCPCERGTVVTVTNLFKTIPVRRQYYKNSRRCKENLKKVEDYLLGFGLSHPEVRFQLRHNSLILWQKPLAANFEENALNVLGAENFQKMSPLNYQCFDPMVKIKALLPGPKSELSSNMTRSTSDRIFVLVNKRPVVIKPLMQLLRQAFVGAFPSQSSRYPVAVLAVSVLPQALDVNLEPNKTFLLLHDMDFIVNTLRSLLEQFYSIRKAAAVNNVATGAGGGSAGHTCVGLPVASDAEGRETVPAVEERKTVPAVEGRETVPAVEGRETVPAVEGRETVPAAERKTVPAVEGRKTVPAVEWRETVPAVEGRETVPAVEGRKTVPAVEGRETVPAVEGRETLLDSTEEALNGLDYEDEDYEDENYEDENRRVELVTKCGHGERERCSSPHTPCRLDDEAVTPELLQEMENESIFSEDESNGAAEVVDGESELEVRAYQATLSQWSRGEGQGGVAKQPVKLCSSHDICRSSQLKSKLLHKRPPPTYDMIDLRPVKRRSPSSDSSAISAQKKLKIFAAKAGTREACVHMAQQQTQILCTADCTLDLDLDGIIGRQKTLLGWCNGREEDGEGKECPDRVIGWCEFLGVEEGRVSGVWLAVRGGYVACFNAERAEEDACHEASPSVPPALLGAPASSTQNRHLHNIHEL